MVWLESKHLGLQFNHFLSIRKDNKSKKLLEQQAKFVDCSSILSSDKTEEIATTYKNSSKLWIELKPLGSSSTILHPLNEMRLRKIRFYGQQANFVDSSIILSPDIGHRIDELEGVPQRDIKT